MEPSEDMFTRSVSPEQAPDKPTYVEIDFEGGDPVAIDGVQLSPATLLTQLNKVLCSFGFQSGRLLCFLHPGAAGVWRGSTLL